MKCQVKYQSKPFKVIPRTISVARMSLLISREFDKLYEMCVDQGWVPRENTEDTMRLVSPGDFAEVRVVMKCDRKIRMSVPIYCHKDPYATQYATHYNDATAAAKFGEFHARECEGD